MWCQFHIHRCDRKYPFSLLVASYAAQTLLPQQLMHSFLSKSGSSGAQRPRAPAYLVLSDDPVQVSNFVFQTRFEAEIESSETPVDALSNIQRGSGDADFWWVCIPHVLNFVCVICSSFRFVPPLVAEYAFHRTAYYVLDQILHP